MHCALTPTWGIIPWYRWFPSPIICRIPWLSHGHFVASLHYYLIPLLDRWLPAISRLFSISTPYSPHSVSGNPFKSSPSSAFANRIAAKCWWFIWLGDHSSLAFSKAPNSSGPFYSANLIIYKLTYISIFSYSN
jgi:hypothetical protein